MAKDMHITINGSDISIEHGIDWSDRDKLPESDPIGDVDNKDAKIYFEMMKDQVIDPNNKNFGIEFINITVTVDQPKVRCCNDPANHKKVAMVYSVLKVCSVCDSKLGDWYDN